MRRANVKPARLVVTAETNQNQSDPIELKRVTLKTQRTLAKRVDSVANENDQRAQSAHKLCRQSVLPTLVQLPQPAQRLQRLQRLQQLQRLQRLQRLHLRRKLQGQVSRKRSKILCVALLLR